MRAASECMIPCPYCGGCGFFGDGPLVCACLDCCGTGEFAVDAPDASELLDAQDAVLAKMPASMEDAMADLFASLADLRASNLRRAA